MTRPRVNLPLEVLQKILVNLERSRDIYQIQLTCKPWAPTAQKRLHENIKTLERTKSPKLTWYNFYPTFDNVMVLLPNIQELKLSPGHLRSLWETIITELGAGKWPLLKETPGPIELDDGDKYSELVFAQKNIVESLHLWVEKPRSCGNWIKKLTKKLHEFERLNHLHLRLHKTVMVSDIEAVSAGHYYSNLESITFGVYDSIQKPGRTFEGLLDDVDYNDRNCEPSNQPYPNILFINRCILAHFDVGKSCWLLLVDINKLDS